MAETRASDKADPAATGAATGTGDENLAGAFFALAHQYGERSFLWTRDGGAWTPWSWATVATRVRALTQGLKRLGLTRGDRVVLVSDNRPEFFIADVAVMAAGGISVPAYTTNTQADHDHVLRDSGATIAICGTPKLAERLFPAAAEAPACHTAILIDHPERAPADAPPVHAWTAVLEDGERSDGDSEADAARLGRDDTACFIYTSGTGGAPKGVMLSHGNVLSNSRMCRDLLAGVTGDDVFLSFLPLSHSYEHTAGQFLPMLLGAQIFYSRGVEHLATEMQEVRPTMVTAVPRLYETMHARIRRGVRKSSRLQRAMFARTLRLGTKRYHRGGLPPLQRLEDAMLDRLVRDKVRARFGGRLKGMVAGGAPLDTEIGLFFTALGVRVLQGYGQTEASPVVACNPPERPKLHTVGPPLAGVEVRIAEDGEILVRGPNVMQGYWNRPDETAGTVRDGWLYTGDLGHFDADGYLEVTDRKKDIIVLSGGDTLSPARVETVLTRQPEIAQAMVAGDGRPHLVALLVPDDTFVEQWASDHGKSANLATLSTDPNLHAALDSVIRRANQDLSLPEQVRRFAVADTAFTIDNALLTPTLKIRRHKIREHFADTLARLT